MKALCNTDGKFEGLIPDLESYEKFKNGKSDWKSNVKTKLKNVTIPYDIFIRLVELDRKCGNNEMET